MLGQAGRILKLDRGEPADRHITLDQEALILVEGELEGLSYARLLRERYGYLGEVRAVGDVLRDQLVFMHRCGFDAFEVAGNDAAGDAADGWLQALGEISVWYQPTADGRPAAMSLRQRRLAALPKADAKPYSTANGTDRAPPKRPGSKPTPRPDTRRVRLPVPVQMAF